MTQDQFEHLLNPVLGPAYGYALQITGNNRDEAADLLQEASVNAFKGRETFQLGTNFKAWFFRILINEFYKRGQKRKLDEVSIDDTPDAFIYHQALAAGVDAKDTDPSALIFSSIESCEIRKALNELPDGYREVSLLYFLSQLSYEEIAEALDIPIGTVRSRLHRARKELQMKLWSMAEERGLVKGAAVG